MVALRWMEKTWRPDGNVADILDIRFPDLFDAGYRLVLLDIDNTLVSHGLKLPDDHSFEAVARIRAAGLECIVVSNARSSRSRTFSERLGVECVSYAGKPSPRGVLEACRRMGIHPDRSVLVGDQLFTDIAAARSAGAASIRVQPLSWSEPPHMHFKRVLERPLLRWFRLDNTYMALPVPRSGRV